MLHAATGPSTRAYKPITFTFKAAVERVVDGLLRGLHGVFAPRLAVVTAQNHDLALLSAQRREVRHLDDHRAAMNRVSAKTQITSKWSWSLQNLDFYHLSQQGTSTQSPHKGAHMIFYPPKSVFLGRAFQRSGRSESHCRGHCHCCCWSMSLLSWLCTQNTPHPIPKSTVHLSIECCACNAQILGCGSKRSLKDGKRLCFHSALFTYQRNTTWLFTWTDLQHSTVTTYPRNLAPTGPISRTRDARASPSISGGGCDSFSFLTSLHVTRVGMHALAGGTMMRTPEWRQPRIAPPRASTMKLTRKLQRKRAQHHKQVCLWRQGAMCFTEGKNTPWTRALHTSVTSTFCVLGLLMHKKGPKYQNGERLGSQRRLLTLMGNTIPNDSTVAGRILFSDRHSFACQHFACSQTRTSCKTSSTETNWKKCIVHRTVIIMLRSQLFRFPLYRIVKFQIWDPLKERNLPRKLRYVCNAIMQFRQFHTQEDTSSQFLSLRQGTIKVKIDKSK